MNRKVQHSEFVAHTGSVRDVAQTKTPNKCETPAPQPMEKMFLAEAKGTVVQILQQTACRQQEKKCSALLPPSLCFRMMLFFFKRDEGLAVIKSKKVF